jgi:hypothetical protein
MYIVAFAIGTASHLVDIARGGWLPYRKYSLGLNIFWTTLTFLDPLAIMLLTYRRRAGLCLAVLIITLDVAVNLSVGLSEFNQSGRFTFWGLYTQGPFGLFVWLTAPMLWSSRSSPATALRSPSHPARP